MVWTWADLGHGGFGGLKPSQKYFRLQATQTIIYFTSMWVWRKKFKFPYVNLFLFSSPPKISDLDSPMGVHSIKPLVLLVIPDLITLNVMECLRKKKSCKLLFVCFDSCITVRQCHLSYLRLHHVTHHSSSNNSNSHSTVNKEDTQVKRITMVSFVLLTVCFISDPLGLI